MTLALPTPPALTVRRNPGPVVRKAPLFTRQTNLLPSPRGARATASRVRGQAYNLTVEEAETFEEVITGKIMVHSKPILALIESGAFHCYISDSFIALHYILIEYLDNQ